ncbi:MAG: hypothetical protein ACJZ9B_01170 [Coraliomargaritaceae bacterium]|jgi:hypothetical protein
MKKQLLGLTILFILLVSMVLSGCMSANPDDQTVPWGRPADWERDTPFYGG